jgi:hypothetical protein
VTLKPGVRITGIRPETVVAMLVAESIWFEATGKQLVVTSCTDGKHSATSLHYSGAAFDCRTLGLDPPVLKTLRGLLSKALGVDYDVVLELDHIHIEFQPKRGTT